MQIYNSSIMPCVITNQVFADGQSSLECDIFDYYAYAWWGAYFKDNTLDRNAGSYTHLRFKIKAAAGYGKIKVACTCEQTVVSVHDPKYSPDGLSIDDLQWRTIYIPLEDLGLTPLMIINETTIVSDDVKPIKFYLDSIAFVKATSQVNPFSNFPILPRYPTGRTSNYTTLNIDDTIDPTVIEAETTKESSAVSLSSSLISLIFLFMLNQ